MEFLTELASGAGGGVIGMITGALGGIASAVVKYKTLKETNRHSFVMAELAGQQEVARAEAELKMVQTEGDIKIDLAAEESLQESFKHDASIGAWLRGRELGKFGTAVMCTAEFVRMMMRPVLTIAAIGYVFVMYGDHFDIAEAEGIAGVVVVSQLSVITMTIILLATTAFSWWFADRSVSKVLAKKIGG